MALVIKGSSSGQITVDVPAAAGTNTVTIPAGTGNLPLSNLDHVTNRPNVQPILYNGDMQITQRATSKTGITGTTMEVQDRWSDVMGGAGTWTQSSDTDVPTGQGFTKSMKWDCTTARTLEAGSIFYIRQTIEAQDLQLLKFGSSSAETLTLCFWLKSPKTGTHIAQLYGADDNRSVSKAYTVSSANTWEKHTINFPADTTGVIDNDNGYGMGLQLWFLAGTTYSSGTLNTTWNTYANADAGVGQVDCADSTDNNILLTGVQLEVGTYTSSTVPSFQHESSGNSLLRCQRFFQKYTQPPLIGIANAGNTVARAKMMLQTQMRTAPSAVHNGTFSWFYSNSHQPTATAFSATYLDENVVEFDATMNVSGMTASMPVNCMQSGTASLDLSAEI